MKIYNTLTGKKEEFIPINEGKVTMYACGITCSGDAHIGHAFQALIYDIIRKYLEKTGYKVTYVRNYTDVDDKIIVNANKSGVPADLYASIMMIRINYLMEKMEIDDPTVWMKATENIGNIISFIEELIKKGHAYATKEGSVYFDVDSFPDYGKLSHRKPEDMMDGVRIDNDEGKKKPYDFALWKAAKEGEIYWESPWGKGRPGWHIECSAMCRAAFGDQVDIHGGGRDLIFPHHENEITQTEAVTGKQFVKYWTHNGLIKVNGVKMSKSLGNSLLLADLLRQYSNEAIKYSLLQTKYRKDINITDNLFSDAERQLTEFYKIIDEVEKKFPDEKEVTEEIDERFNTAMDDDFNTALALSDLFEFFKNIKAEADAGDKKARRDVNQIRKTYSLLGLFTKSAEEYLKKYAAEEESAVPEEVKALAEERKKAKADKNYALSDELRGKITVLGFNVLDKKGGEYEIVPLGEKK